MTSSFFHLNHVGYKEKCPKNGQKRQFVFHLNHVGYKVIYWYHLSCMTSNSFIWTMWDIKLYFKRLYKLLFPNFHLNHVGYKDWLSNESIKNLMPFIWTMWDIKVSVGCFCLWVYHTFIWTMWDIKACRCLLSPERTIFHLNHVGYKGQRLGWKRATWRTFHLNHVGYKVSKLLACLLLIIAFIWTMWDIKQAFRWSLWHC